MRADKGKVMIGRLPVEAGRPLLVGVVAAPGWEDSDWPEADILELRLDRFLALPDSGGAGLETSETERWVEALGKRTRKPILLTLRHPGESDCPDRCEPRDDVRRVALIRALAPLCQAVDIEVGAPYAGTLAAFVSGLGLPVIGSWHDFRRTPPERLMHEKMRRAFNLGARVFKLACRVEKPAEAISLLSFGQFFGRSGLLAIAPMGARSHLIRLAAPYFGSTLVYGSLGRETAPGQPGVSSLRADLDRFYRSRRG